MPELPKPSDTSIATAPSTEADLGSTTDTGAPAPSDRNSLTIGPGSTVRGDIPRGEGVFLPGASWYDLNETKTMSIRGFEGVGLPGSILGP